MTTITLKIVDDKDAAEILENLSRKDKILWRNDSMVAAMEVNVKKKEIIIRKGVSQFTRIRL